VWVNLVSEKVLDGNEHSSCEWFRFLNGLPALSWIATLCQTATTQLMPMCVPNPAFFQPIVSIRGRSGARVRPGTIWVHGGSCMHWELRYVAMAVTGNSIMTNKCSWHSLDSWEVHSWFCLLGKLALGSCWRQNLQNHETVSPCPNSLWCFSDRWIMIIEAAHPCSQVPILSRSGASADAPWRVSWRA